MKQEIRAIETRYKGYRFRSRLEARWAVFFDALSLSWEYEPEGFHTSAGPYLPDFRVMTPQGKPIWYEIKPECIEADSKLEAFEALVIAAEADTEAGECSSARVGLLTGDPVSLLAKPDVTICPRCGFIHKPDYGFEIEPTSHPRLRLFEWSVGCWPCDVETPSGGDNPWEDGILGFGVYPHKGWVKAILPTDKPWASAAEKARSARFEHGETP